MSLANINNRTQKERGFTIVELLIVIVVIAILAAITVVSYNGITARANTSSARSQAQNVIKKIEAYNAELASYPTLANLNDAPQSASYGGLPSTAFTTGALSAAPPTAVKVAFYRCGTNGSSAATDLATVTSRTGVRIDYWNYQASPAAANSVAAGQVSGTSSTATVNCYVEAGTANANN